MKSLCVFCGSNAGARPAYAEAARQMGRLLAARGITVVYGGGNVGLMGILADSALAAGGSVIGVIPQSLVAWEVAHTGLADLRVVGSMHERKALMAELADAFVALPGGFGTFEEFFEVLTWAQLGFHQKPCGLLNIDGFYDLLLTLIDHGIAERFIRPEHRALVVEAHDPASLLDVLADYQPPSVEKWIASPDET